MKTSFVGAVALAVFSPVSLACSSSSASPAGPADASSGGADTGVETSTASDGGTPVEASTLDAAGIVAARPYTMHVPTGYKAGTPAPLVVMFHGYGATGDIQESYFQLANISDEHGFLYAYGDGTLDSTGSRFWNATNACCDLYDSGVDDVQYFDAILADVRSKFAVDPKRIFVVGHSNGAFMSHRLACDRATTVASIVSLEGAQWEDLGHCNPADKVAVVEVHGNADMTIFYDGGMTMEGTYPSAPTTVADWAKRNGCTGTLSDTGQTNQIVTGDTTQVLAYQGCPPGIDVQLWLVQGGIHIPALNNPTWGEDVWTFLSAHPKP